MRRALAALALLWLVALAPLAAAATPVEGRVEFASDALLAGPAALSSSRGALDLAPALAAGESLVLSWTRAEGRLVTAKWIVTRDPTGLPNAVEEVPRSPPDVLDLGPGSLRGVSCVGRCDLLVLALGGSVSLAGAAAGPVRWTEEPMVHWAHWSKGGPDGFRHEVPAGALLAASRSHGDLPVTLVDQARPVVEGRVGVFVTNATVEVATPEGTRLVDTVPRRAPVGGVPGAVEVERVASSYLYVELEGASLEAAPGSAALLLAPDARVALDGRLQAARATGRIGPEGAGAAFEDAPLSVEGSLVLTLGTAERPLGGVAGPAAAGLGARRLHALVEGEATSVQVGHASLVAPEGQAARLAPAGLAGLLAALLLRGPLAALYSRITRSRVLANGNRRRLHDLVRAQPGRTTADLAREAGLARVVVKHHLRMLEAHRLVLCRADGRRRRFFPVDAGPAVEAASLRILLEDANRRKVADALAASPLPLTQKQLARLTGLSQRVVSYHLGRLAAAGLLRVESGMPQRYAFERAAMARLDLAPRAAGMVEITRS